MHLAIKGDWIQMTDNSPVFTEAALYERRKINKNISVYQAVRAMKKNEIQTEDRVMMGAGGFVSDML